MKRQLGYSLVEMIVVIALYTLLMLVVYTAVLFFYRTNSYTVQQTAAVSNGRRAVNEMVEDMREVTEGDNGAFPLIAIDDNSIEFYSDIDRDFFVEKARYYISVDGNFIREKTDPDPGSDPVTYTGTPEVDILAQYIINDLLDTNLFYYVDGNGSVVTDYVNDIVDVRYILARLVVNVDPVRQPDEFVIKSGAILRNLETIVE